MLRLGIDFGTCYSSAALLLEGVPTPINAPLTPGYSLPSSVFITEKGEILVGQVAEHNRQKNPQSYRREFKRDLGSPDPYTLGNVFMLPEELITEVLKKLKGEAEKVAQGRGEKSLTDALITVPATYSSYKRNLMQEAGVKAGFSQIQLLEEPVAAAIYYSHHAQINDEDIILVYDLGGGTFDVTLMQKQGDKYQVLGMPKGLERCGGTDFDRLIYQKLKSSCSAELRQQLDPKNAQLARAIVSDLCRELKHQLSEQSEASIYIPMGLGNVESFELTRDAFNEMISPLIEEALDCCDQLVRSAGKNWQQVNQILLVGGSSRIPYVKEAIEKRFKISPFLVDKPELAVCLGAAICNSIPSSKPEDKLREQKAIQQAFIQQAFEERETKEREAEIKVKAENERKRKEEILHQREEKRQEAQEAEPENLSARAEDYYNRGNEKYQTGDYVGAIADFDQVIRLEPNNSIHYSNRGNAYYRQGEYQQAITDFDQAIRLNPNDADFYAGRGIAYSTKGEYQQAIADFDQAIHLEPNNAGFYCNRGIANLRNEYNMRAIADYDQAIHLAPNNADFYSNRGSAYSNQGEYQKAIADYDQAIRLDSNNVTAYNKRGNAYLKRGGYQRAIDDYDQAIRLDPNNADFYFNRGNAYFKQGDNQRAIADYNQALKIDPNSAEADSVRTQIDQIRLQLDGQKQKDVTNYKREDSAELKHQEKEIQQAFEEREAEIKSNGRLSDGADSYFKKLIPHLQSQGFQCSKNIPGGNYTLDWLAIQKKWIPFRFGGNDFKLKYIIPLIYIGNRIELNLLQKFPKDCLCCLKENALASRSGWFSRESFLICPIIVVDEIDSDLAVMISQEKPFIDVERYILSGVYGLKNKRVFFNQGAPYWGWGDYFDNWRKSISSILTR